jgi:hypothetical protein
VVVAAPRIRIVILNCHCSDIRAREFSSELEPASRCDYLPSVNELIRCIEELESVEKERTLLRVKQREPLVEENLSNIGLDLREVRIDRRVQGEVLPHTPLRIRAEFTFSFISSAVIQAWCSINARRHRRSCLQYESSTHVVQSFKSS